MKTTGSLLALLALFPCWTLAAPPAAGPDKQRAERAYRSAELDRLIQAIHDDLKQARKDHPWLSEYNDKCLHTGGRRSGALIYFANFERNAREQPQQPDHISITYCRVGDSNTNNARNTGTFWKAFPNVSFSRWA